MVKHISLLNSRIADRYAKSLFDLAYESNCLELVEQQLNILNVVFVQNIDIAKIIKSPLSTQVKLKQLIKFIIAKFLTATNSKIVNSFLHILVKNNRLKIFGEIYQSFQKILLEQRNELKVEVVSAFPFNDAEQQKLNSVLKEFVNKNILLTSRIDTSIIGGFIVNFGSYQIDESIVTKLNLLKFALKEVS